MRIRSGGRPGAGRIITARCTWACAAALTAALTVGCGQTAGRPAADVSVPTPQPSPTFLASPSGTPAPVPADLGCQEKTPAPMSPMPAPGQMPAGTTMATILGRGYLIAGVDQDSYAWGYPNPSPSAPSGESYAGFDIDLLHAIAQAIFGNPNKIHFVPVTQDFRMGAGNQGIVDVVADSVTITCPRTDQVNFSINYFDAAQEVLVPRDNHTISVTLDSRHVPHVHGLAGRKVCTVRSTTSTQNLTALAKADRFGVVDAGNWSDCLVLLEQGTVQAVSTDNTILGGLAAEDPYVKLIGAPFSHEPHGLAFPQHDPASSTNREFVSFVNGVIVGLESNAGGYCPEPRATSDLSCWAALYRRWVEPQLGQPPAPPTPIFSTGPAG
jgi:polar amino acid transport system substrate-binding protein